MLRAGWAEKNSLDYYQDLCKSVLHRMMICLCNTFWAFWWYLCDGTFLRRKLLGNDQLNQFGEYLILQTDYCIVAKRSIIVAEFSVTLVGLVIKGKAPDLIIS